MKRRSSRNIQLDQYNHKGPSSLEEGCSGDERQGEDWAMMGAEIGRISFEDGGRARKPRKRSSH